jgi:hypothetical protein
MSDSVDIGQYDGGFERDEERYKERVATVSSTQQDGLRQLDTDVERSVFRHILTEPQCWSVLSLVARTIHHRKTIRKRFAPRTNSAEETGHFGRVYLARTKLSPGYILALKCLQKDQVVRKGVQNQVRREIQIMEQLRWVAQPCPSSPSTVQTSERCKTLRLLS